MKLKRILPLLMCFLLIATSVLTSCRDVVTTAEDSDDTGTEAESQGGDITDNDPVITGPYADTIMYSNSLANGVQAYYGDPMRSYYVIENQTSRLEYSLSGESKLITSLTDKNGVPYMQDTSDVFVTTSDGKTYFASDSTASPYTNIYRMGYYYYDTHIMGQNFLGGASVTKEMPFNIKTSTVKSHQVKELYVKNGLIEYIADGSDPYVYTALDRQTRGLYFAAEEYNAVQFSMKATCSSGELYFLAGEENGHSPEHSVRFDVKGDGQWHTYTLVLSIVENYEGLVTSLRFDVGNEGEAVSIKDIKAVDLESDAPEVLLDRTFHAYSDKMNQVLHFVANKEINGISGMGFIHSIPESTVDKLVIKDKNGTHGTLDGVDFASAEYVGFDIKGAGALGFILLPHENSGRLDVTLNGGVYTVTQTAVPEGGRLVSDPSTTEDDFYMGHRLYTDGHHSFDAFIKEAEAERSPLETVEGKSYLGYDALRGAYKFAIAGTGFNEPFFYEQNRHYRADISVKGADKDRSIYIYTQYQGGCGENALILDENDMLLPIPVMINKNFKGENEEPLYDPGDSSYSETYFPLSVKAGSETELTVLNLYMNWGKLPLKQLSSIQFFWPYYHLSLGTTETSCISPFYGAKDLWTLPDFRPLSMPYWFELPEGQGYDNQPQHTHAGYQYFLQYTDAEGKYSATENYNNEILSSGPVYTDVRMDYISDDGRIKVSYDHIEMPETDELRAYYEIHYEVLEDIAIDDFARDFSFYSLEGYQGEYRKLGYLDKDNKIAHKSTNRTAAPEVLKLGDEFPYVALYDLDTAAPSFINNNANLGFIVADSEFTIGGKPCDAGFVAVGSNAKYSLSLDLGSVTLKKGDTMTLCIIISPWGFYTSKDDSNMQRIRQNTCIDPLKLTVEEGKAIDTVFVPSLRTENGVSAEFTVSGSSNNKTVRVYGFDKLTVPEIYEKIEGEWVKLDISSHSTPDKLGYSHYYDGYAVYYDGDGTYSYAFAFNMDEKESRSFKIVASEDFVGWSEEEEEAAELNVHVPPASIAMAAEVGKGISKAEVLEDGAYARIYGKTGEPEAFFQAYSGGDFSSVGQYLVIKYRLCPNVAKRTEFEVFTSTENSGATAGDSFYISQLPRDDEWHILIADLSQQMLPTFKENAQGEYAPKHLRLDIFNHQVTDDDYIDIAYIIIEDSIEEICKFHKNEGEADLYVRGAKSGTLDLSTGKMK